MIIIFQFKSNKQSGILFFQGNIINKLLFIIIFLINFNFQRCQPISQYTSDYIFCKNKTYLDSKTYQCLSCQDNCDSCYTFNQCQVCTYGNLKEDICLDHNRVCPSGFKFSEEKNYCTKCKVDFCILCDMNDICVRCQKGFNLVNNFFCEKSVDQDLGSNQISCNVGQDEKSGYCFQNSICSYQNFKPQEVKSVEIIQILEFKESKELIFVYGNSIKIYDYDEVIYKQEVFRLSDNEDEYVLACTTTKSYLVIHTNKSIQLFSLPTYLFLKKKNLNQVNQIFISSLKFLFSNKDNDQIFQISYEQNMHALRVRKIQLEELSNQLSIESDQQIFSSNKLSIKAYSFIQDANMMIAITQQKVLLHNFNQKEANQGYQEISFQFENSIQTYDQITYRRDDNQLLIYVLKQTENKAHFLKCIFNVEQNKIIDFKIQDFKWKDEQNLSSYSKLFYQGQMQQQKNGIYYISQIGLKSNTLESQDSQIFIGVTEIENIFSSSNKFHYQSFNFNLQLNHPFNSYIQENLDNLNQLIIVIPIGGQIKFFNIENNSQNLPYELTSNAIQIGNNNYQVQYLESLIDSQNLIVSKGEQVTIISMRDLLLGNCIFKQNEIYKSLFSYEQIFQVIILTDIKLQQISLYSFILINLKTIGLFELIQFRQNQRGEQEIAAKRSIYFKELERMNQIIDEGSFYNEEEQLIYVITKKGIYIIYYHNLTTQKYIPLNNFILRNQQILMVVLPYFQSDPSQVPFNQIVLVELQKSELVIKNLIQTFQNYEVSEQTDKYQIQLNPYFKDMYFITYINDQNYQSFKLIVDNQEIDLSLIVVTRFMFLSQLEFAYIINMFIMTHVKITLQKDSLGQWSILDRQEVTLNDPWDCQLMQSTYLSLCFQSIPQQNVQYFVLFDWNQMKLISNTPFSSDQDPIQYLEVYQYGNFHIDNQEFYTQSNEILITLREQQTNISSQYDCQLKIQLEPIFQLLNYPYNQWQCWYLDNNSNLKDISDQNFFVQRNPKELNHIRIIFKSLEYFAAELEMSLNLESESFAYWKQKNQLIFQDNGKAIVVKEIGKLSRKDKIIIDQLIAVSEKLGMVIYIVDNKQINFVTLDMKNIQYTIQSINQEPIYALFWSEKYLSLIYIDDQIIQVYNNSNFYNQPVYSYQTPFKPSQHYSSVCIILQQNPFFVCNSFGILNFSDGEIYLYQDLVVHKLEKTISVSLVENDSFFLSILYQSSNSSTTAFRFDIQKKQFEKQLLFGNIQFDGFPSFYMHPSIQNQIIFKAKRQCGVIDFQKQIPIQAFQDPGFSLIYCIYLQEEKKILMTIQNELSIYQLPIYPNDNPIFRKQFQLEGEFIQDLLKNNIYYRLTRMDSEDNSQYARVQTINIVTGETVTKTFFFKQPSALKIQYWEEKNLIIFLPNYLYSIGQMRYVWQTPADTSLIGYSSRFNYLISTYMDFDNNINYLSTVDISETFPFSLEQNTLINILKVNNINFYSDQKIADQTNKNYIVYFNQQKYQIIKFYLSQEDNQSILIDFKDSQNSLLFNDANKIQYQSPFQIVNLQDKTSKNLIFGIHYQCKLVFYQNNIIIDQIDLKDFQCQITAQLNNLFIINQKQQSIKELIYLNGKITQLEISLHSPPDYIISEIHVAKSGDWILILLADRVNFEQNIVQLKSYDKGDYLQLYEELVQNVRAHLFISLSDQQYLILGTEDENIHLYQLFKNSDLKIKLKQSIQLKYGRIFNIKEMIEETQSSSIANIYISTQNRVLLISGNLINNKSEYEDQTLKFQNSHQIHTRQQHLLRILGDSYVAILSQIQITIYSLSLQYICRIEEISFQYLNDIFIGPDNKTILVVDKNTIYSFKINLINSRERLILQQQFSYQNPIIYEVSPILNNQESFMIYGVSSNSIIKINYSLQISSKLDDPSNCVRYISTLDSLDEQMKQYIEVLQNAIPFNQMIKVAIKLQKKQQILLPYFNRYQYSTISQQQEKYLSIEIDLSGQQANLYQSVIQEFNIIKQLKLSNGELFVKENLTLQNMEQIIFRDILIVYEDSFTQIKFINVTKVTFDNVKIKKQTLENKNNSKQKLDHYLFNIVKVNTIIMNIIALEELQMKDIGLFYIELTQSTLINNISLMKSSINFDQPVFNFIKNQLIQINKIKAIDSSLLQLFAFQNSTEVLLNDLYISNLKVINLERIRLLQQGKVDTQVLEEDIEKGSLIKIRFTKNYIKINQVVIKDYSKLNVFLYSNNELDQKQQIIDQGELLENITQQTYLTSTIQITDLNIKNTQFKIILGLLKENSITIRNIKVKDSQNCQFNLFNGNQLLKLEDIVFENNKLLSQSPLIKIENSNVIIQNVTFSEINILEDRTSQQSCISLYKSRFIINKLQASNTKFVDYFLIILDSFTQSSQSDTKSQIINSIIQQTIGGALFIQNIENLEIIDTVIKQNKSKDNGGGVYLLNVMNSLFKNVRLLNNKAESSGGGVYLEQSNLELEDCLIQQNSAQIGGGIRYNNTNIIPIFLSQNIIQQIKDNTANIFGDNYCSFPSKIEMIEIGSEEYQLIQQDSSQKDEINNYNNAVSSINQQSTVFAFKLLDENNQIVKLPQTQPNGNNLSRIESEIFDYYKFNLQFNEENDKVVIQNRNNSNIYIGSPYYHFAFIKYLTNTGYSNILKTQQEQSFEILMNIASKSQLVIPIQQKNKIKLVQSQIKQQFTLKFRACKQGEIIENTSEDFYICWRCKDNTYSLNDPYKISNNLNYGCKECPHGTIYCEGNEINTIDGYWHGQNSDTIFLCQNSQNACSSGQDSKFGCREGYFGPLCESCDYDNQVWGRDELTGDIERKYAKKGQFKCTECNDQISQQNQYSISICIGIIFIIYLGWQINSNFESKKNKLRAIVFKKLGVIYVQNSLDDKEKTSILLKIIINYMQLVMIASSFIINVPDWLKFSLALGNVLDSTMYSLDCLFVKSDLYQSIPMVYLRFLWTLLLPIVYMVVLFIGLLIYTKVKQQKLVRKRSFIISAFLKIYFMVFTSIIKVTIGNMSCKLINGTWFVLNDLQFECFDSNYFFYNVLIGLPYTLIVILTPYFIYKILKANSHRLYQDINIFLGFGFFFVEFKQSYSYWEIVRMYQKIFTYLIIGLFNQDNLVSSIFISIVIIFYMMFQIKLSPFKYNLFNRIDLLSQLTAILTILGMSINAQSSSDNILATLSLVIIAISNIYFIVRIIKCLFENILPAQIIDAIHKIKMILHKILPKYFSQPLKFKVNIVNVTKNWKKLKQNIDNQNIFKKLKHQNLLRENILSKFSKSISEQNEKENLLTKSKPDENAIVNSLIQQENEAQNQLSKVDTGKEDFDNICKTQQVYPLNFVKLSKFKSNQLSQLSQQDQNKDKNE